MRTALSILVISTLFAVLLVTDARTATATGDLGAAPLAVKRASLAVGSRVMAPWSRTNKLYQGTVTALYGKLAHIDFDDGDRGWAEVTRIRPAGSPRAVPNDRCAVQRGQAVMAPWSRTKRMYPGTVSEVHGKLARIDFNDGDRGWALCGEIRALAQRVSIGAKVMAPWSRAGKMYPGTVAALYGKLARIDFDDGDQGWAEVTRLRPAGRAKPTPNHTCSVRVGQKVMAPWSRTKRMYRGTVSEVHGKLARIDFDDGDRGWALCREMRVR